MLQRHLPVIGAAFFSLAAWIGSANPTFAQHKGGGGGGNGAPHAPAHVGGQSPANSSPAHVNGGAPRSGNSGQWDGRGGNWYGDGGNRGRGDERWGGWYGGAWGWRWPGYGYDRWGGWGYPYGDYGYDYGSTYPYNGDAYGYNGPDGYRSFYPSTDDRNDTATLRVIVPANARVLFNGQPTRQQGEQRQFLTPPLQADRNYVYELQAQWTQDGREVVQRREVGVHPGDRVTVNFLSTANEPAAAPDQVPAATRDNTLPPDQR